ncbi:protealysin inhibitor emfourin [Streptosporangium lutulentum]|uniref:Metalloprotease n=1 Tax=Streptosporangium lutulentum TaxID=1461250 RepID=A0ABT9Q7K4_9ACTN|nr:protealysin inhibitor emfourin [Streptosporangium lutulentum]MDP9842390.1 hypothetical protein [Streptosporangium lutulentum]
MKVSIVRGGGFAGLVTITTVDSASLTPGDAATLRAKVEQAGLSEPPGREGGSPPMPDRFDYEVTVEDRGRAHTVRVSEQDLSAPLRSLIAYVDSLPGRQERVGPPG